LKANIDKGKKAKADVVANTNDFAVVDKAQNKRVSKVVGKKRGSLLLCFTQERLTQGLIMIEVADDANLANDELSMNISFR
jgi:hypothetical protein